MSIIANFFRQQSIGHWDNSGPFGRLHTRSLPQMGCPVCEAAGWIPASKPAPAMTTCQESPDADAESTADDTPAYLAMAAEEVTCAIRHVELACGDSRVDGSVRAALDALRDALTAIEAQMEAGNAE